MQEYVYLFQAGRYSKIGISINPQSRLGTILNSDHPTDLPCRPEFVHAIAVDAARRAERALHQFFREMRVVGEWFTLDDADVNWFRVQSADTLIAMADSMGVRHYDKQPRKPIQSRPLREYTSIRLNLPTDIVEELKGVANLDRREVNQELAWILKNALPAMRQYLETDGPHVLPVLTVIYGRD